MKSVNESLICQGKLNILRFQLNISREDIYSASCLARQGLQNGVILKSPVILRVVQIKSITRIPMFSRSSKE